jgi:hypothetical protein
MTEAPTVGLIGCAAGGLERIREELIEPLIDAGLRVATTLTPTGHSWLAPLGELDRIRAVTGFEVRSLPRGPREESPHPPVACYAVVPATANTVAKLAMGIADNQALTAVGEALGHPNIPVVIFPRINASHARHPAWHGHLAALRRAGVELIYGDDVWPLHEPGSAPRRTLPWAQIRNAITDAARTAHS